jgi:hypothetical protein
MLRPRMISCEVIFICTLLIRGLSSAYDAQKKWGARLISIKEDFRPDAAGGRRLLPGNETANFPKRTLLLVNDNRINRL